MRIGIDLGGTKIAGIALAERGRELARHRSATPRGYDDTLQAVAAVVAALETDAGRSADGVGIALPGIVDAGAGSVRAVNLPWLTGSPLVADLSRRLGRPVRIANDANCFALSEAVDGAAAGAATVFGAILGTGVGGGIAVGGGILPGANGMAGEWGHAPLPWRRAEDGPEAVCGCGRSGCIETVLCGAGLTRLHAFLTGEAEVAPPVLATRSEAGDPAACATLAAHADALARALAPVLNLLDPEVVVVGGGLSNLPGLYERVPALWGRWTLQAGRTRFVRARHGGESGMRGAAWLIPGR